MAASTEQGAFDLVTPHVESFAGHALEDFLRFMKRNKNSKRKVKLS